MWHVECKSSLSGGLAFSRMTPLFIHMRSTYMCISVYHFALESNHHHSPSSGIPLGHGLDLSMRPLWPTPSLANQVP